MLRNQISFTACVVLTVVLTSLVAELVAVVVAFFICWAPFHTQRLYAIYVTPPPDGSREHEDYLKAYEIVTYISGVLYYVSTTINPLLYNIMSNKFREAFKETFSRWCCSARPGRPQRSYSILSRSAQRGPDSTDSGKDEPSIHTHTTTICKSSSEISNHNAPGRRYSRKASLRKSNQIDIDIVSWPKDKKDLHVYVAPDSDFKNIQPDMKLVSVHISGSPRNRLNKLMQFFRGITRRTSDDNRRVTTYYAAPPKDVHIALELQNTNKPETFSITSGDISNSSLKDAEKYALEDGLTSDMSHDQNREGHS